MNNVRNAKCIFVVGWFLARWFLSHLKYPNVEYFEKCVSHLRSKNDRECVAMFSIFFAARQFQSATVLRLYDVVYAIDDKLKLAGNLSQAIIEAAAWEERWDVVNVIFDKIDYENNMMPRNDLYQAAQFLRQEVVSNYEMLAHRALPASGKYFPYVYYVLRAKARVRLEMWREGLGDICAALRYIPLNDRRRGEVESLYYECWSHARNAKS